MEKPTNIYLPPGTTDRDLDDMVRDGSDPADLCDAVLEAANDDVIARAFDIAVLNPRPPKV